MGAAIVWLFFRIGSTYMILGKVAFSSSSIAVHALFLVGTIGKKLLELTTAVVYKSLQSGEWSLSFPKQWFVIA